MFREQWKEIEKRMEEFATEMREKFAGEFHSKTNSFKDRVVTEEERLKLKEDFLKWGNEYVDKLKGKVDNEKISEMRENFFVLLRNLGINDQLLRETFASNKKELLDPIIGESIAIVTLVLGWSKKDKEAFSQALGEIGVAGVFAAKPFICLIAVCGLAYGYNRTFHKEAFKKGGVLALSGMTAAWLAPGAFVGLLAAVVTMMYFNKKLSVDKPIEKQLKEIFQQIRKGEFFGEVRMAWKNFENFLSQLFKKETQEKSNLVVN